MRAVHIIAGGQFGSEGKGAFTAALTLELKRRFDENPVLVRVAGPNAGHTAYDAQGRKWSLRQIPVGAVVNLKSAIVIGQQSEIDLAVIHEEITTLEAAGIPIMDRLAVDRMATIINMHHVDAERNISTGTTGKGIGGARSGRLLRTADVARDIDTGLPLMDTTAVLRMAEEPILIEGTQGYGLGLHTDYYPYVTSSNTRCGDFLAMTGLQPWEFQDVFPWVVFRSHPIRIAGNSGPLKDETTWEEVGQPTEFTTVTKKPRRVGEWDSTLAHAALRANGAPRCNAVFTFLDYLVPSLAGETEPTEKLRAAVGMVQELVQYPISWVGTGPQTGVFRPAGGVW